jgi:cytochrome c oxidase cbb3-type subunit 3
VLNYSTRGEVAAEIERVDAGNAEVAAVLASADLTTLAPGDPAHTFGIAGGEAVFRAHCSQCHGSGAAGAVGYPNLLDDDWLWGGDVSAIEATVRHGIRSTADDEGRYSQMPAFGEFWEKDEIAATAEYVLALSGQDHDPVLAATGQPLFVDNCASCHGEAGLGDREQGAPNLADAIWLYGGDREDVTHSIKYARSGVMPPWGKRLSEAEIKAVTLYVHQLGGGE